MTGDHVDLAFVDQGRPGLCGSGLHRRGLWLLDDQEHTQVFEEIVGARPITPTVVLVIGRDSGLAPADRRRLEWRRDHVVINSQHLYCCTFDELVRDLRWRARWRPWIQEGAPPS